jgi:hypothetical protein
MRVLYRERERKNGAPKQRTKKKRMFLKQNTILVLD